MPNSGAALPVCFPARHDDDDGDDDDDDDGCGVDRKADAGDANGIVARRVLHTNARHRARSAVTRQLLPLPTPGRRADNMVASWVGVIGSLAVVRSLIIP